MWNPEYALAIPLERIHALALQAGRTLEPGAGPITYESARHLVESEFCPCIRGDPLVSEILARQFIACAQTPRQCTPTGGWDAA
jgi:hypothetical protein